MVEVSQPFVGEAGGLRVLAGTLRSAWKVALACGLAALLLAVLGLRLVPAQHTASMVVGPTARTGVAAMGPRMPVHGADGAFGLAEPGTGEETLSDFSRFLELLGSVPVAARLMADPGLAPRLFPERWDGAGWVAPTGVGAALKRLALGLAGREDWVEPDAEAVAARLRRMLVVAPVGTSPMRRLSLRHTDRAFALDLLGRVAAAADAHLRAEASRRSAAQVAHVRAKLGTVTQADHRRPLVDLLAEQERVSLLIEVDLPFAADPIQPPAAARQPDWPDPLLVLPGALAGGLALGAFLATYRAVRRG
ncbi:MAG TPA: hypothetical protein VD860_13445 [Azospirillum sp.]|nr:hypothetical protein [Azospirillum sp.]